MEKVIGVKLAFLMSEGVLNENDMHKMRQGN